MNAILKLLLGKVLEEVIQTAATEALKRLHSYLTPSESEKLGLLTDATKATLPPITNKDAAKVAAANFIAQSIKDGLNKDGSSNKGV